MVGTDDALGKLRRLASPISDDLDAGCEELSQSLDVALPERIEEPRCQLLAFSAVRFEPRTPDIHVAARPAACKESPASGQRPHDNPSCLRRCCQRAVRSPGCWTPAPARPRRPG